MPIYSTNNVSFSYNVFWLLVVALVIEKSKFKFLNSKIWNSNHFLTKNHEKKIIWASKTPFLTIKKILIWLKKTQNQTKLKIFSSLNLSYHALLMVETSLSSSILKMIFIFLMTFSLFCKHPRVEMRENLIDEHQNPKE